ncbi:MAG TPA: alpha/beta hydrolase [bacterium]|nr:alpha/beta hydrolase [bacterium]
MVMIKTRDGTELYTKDWGSGKPIVFIHGWPLNADMWEYQMTPLAAHYRCIAYDRRGFGRSSQPWTGYDYDTFADDLKRVIETLELEGVTLVGFSMGGGEVARYLARHGTERVAKAVMIAAVPPLLLKLADNPQGVGPEVFDGMRRGISADRPQFFTEFAKNFYGANHGSKISPGIFDWTLFMAMQASLKATLDCTAAFSETDFRPDLKAFTIPTLIIHGDDDQIVPIELTANIMVKEISGAQIKVYPGAPHGLYFTHKDQLNKDLQEFIG